MGKNLISKRLLEPNLTVLDQNFSFAREKKSCTLDGLADVVGVLVRRAEVGAHRLGGLGRILGLRNLKKFKFGVKSCKFWPIFSIFTSI